MAVVYAVILSVFLTGTPAGSQSAKDLIEEVRIQGNRRIPTDTIKYRLQTKAGHTLNRASISHDVKALYGLGYFENIRVEELAGSRGFVVVFHVEERPLIRTVNYEGFSLSLSPRLLNYFEVRIL